MGVKITEAVKKSELIYDKYNQNDRVKWADKAVKNIDFKMGGQWEKTDAAAQVANDQPIPVSNQILPSIDLMVSMITENNPRWVFSGTEPSDASIASSIADLHSHIWKTSKGTYVNERAVTDYVSTGIGAFMIYIDPYMDFGKGEILIAPIDPQDLYLDPNSKLPDSTDSQHILIVKDLTEDQVEEDHPDIDIDSLNQTTKGSYPVSSLDLAEDQVQYPELNEIRLFQAIDRYSKIRVIRYHVFDPTSGYEMTFTEEDFTEYANEPAVILIRVSGEEYETRPFRVKELQELAEQTGGIFHQVIDPNGGEVRIEPGAEQGGISVPGSTTQIKLTIKNELIDSGIIKVDKPRIKRIQRVYSIGGKEIVNDIMPIEDYPIVTFMLHHNRNPYPMSDIALVESLQEQLNKISSLIIAYNTNITNVKFFVPRDGTLKKELDERGGRPGMEVFEFDPDIEQPPFVIQLIQMSVALYEEKRELKEDIQRIIGAFAISDGDVSQAPRTKGGTQLLDEFGQRRVALKRKRLESALNQSAKVISQFIPRVYTEEKVIRIVEPNHQSRSTTFNQPSPEDASQIINDLSVRHDVECIASSTLPTNKQQRFDIMINAYQAGIIQDNTAVIQYMDIPDVDRLIEREDKIKQAEQLLQQAEEEIKNLKGNLQTAEREVVQSRKQVKVEKFGADLDRLSNKVEAEVLLTKARLGDEVKKNKDNNKPKPAKK